MLGAKDNPKQPIDPISQVNPMCDFLLIETSEKIKFPTKAPKKTEDSARSRIGLLAQYNWNSLEIESIELGFIIS